MSTTLSLAAKNALLDALTARLSAGSDDPTPDLNFRASDDTSLCICNFSLPAFQPASGARALAATIARGTVENAPTPKAITKAYLRTRNNVIEMTVGVAKTSGQEIALTENVVSNGDTIDISSLELVYP